MSDNYHAPVRRPTPSEVQRGWATIDAGLPLRRRSRLAQWAFVPAFAVALAVVTWWWWRTPPPAPLELSRSDDGRAGQDSPPDHSEPTPPPPVAPVRFALKNERQVVVLPGAGHRVEIEDPRMALEAVSETSIAIQRVSASSVRIEVLRGGIFISSATTGARLVRAGEEAIIGDAPPRASAAVASPKSTRNNARSLGPVPAVVETPQPTAAPSAEARVQTGPDEFVLGTEARQRGDFVTALSLYERFIAAAPEDQRAPLAMMEAARILADHDNQPNRALRHIDALLARKLSASLREDAMARRVQLLGATGARKLCHDVRDEFLDDYPRSVHVEEVRRACDMQ